MFDQLIDKCLVVTFQPDVVHTRPKLADVQRSRLNYRSLQDLSSRLVVDGQRVVCFGTLQGNKRGDRDGREQDLWVARSPVHVSTLEPGMFFLNVKGGRNADTLVVFESKV